MSILFQKELKILERNKWWYIQFLTVDTKEKLTKKAMLHKFLLVLGTNKPQTSTRKVWISVKLIKQK